VAPVDPIDLSRLAYASTFLANIRELVVRKISFVALDLARSLHGQSANRGQ
jgi:hypothetical protein